MLFLAGLTGIILGVLGLLGILAVAGRASIELDLVALLVLGAALLVTGNGMNNAMIGVFGRMPARG